MDACQKLWIKIKILLNFKNNAAEAGDPQKYYDFYGER